MVGKVTDDKKMSASRLPALLGHSPYSSRNEELVYGQKAIAGELVPWEGNEATGWGNRLETICICESAERLNVDRVVTDIDKPYIHPEIALEASLDAVGEFKEPKTFTNDPERGIYVIGQDSITLSGCGCMENKVTSVRPEDAPALSRGPIQAQGQMDCAGFDWAAICVLYQGIELRTFLFERHQPTIDAIHLAVADFERRLHSDPIDWYDIDDDHPGDTLIIYPEAEEEVPVILDADYVGIVESYMSAKQTIKDCETVIKKCDVVLQGAMGNHAIAHAGGYEIKWPMRHTKAQPEKTVPAKPATSKRQSIVSIKEMK